MRYFCLQNLNPIVDKAVNINKSRDSTINKKVNVSATKVINTDKEQDVAANKELNTLPELLMAIKIQMPRPTKLRDQIEIGYIAK